MFLRQHALPRSGTPEPCRLEWFPRVLTGSLPVELLLALDHGEPGKILPSTNGFADEPGALIKIRIEGAEIGTAREEMFAVTLFESPITVAPRPRLNAFHGPRCGVLPRL